MTTTDKTRSQALELIKALHNEDAAQYLRDLILADMKAQRQPIIFNSPRNGLWIVGREGATRTLQSTLIGLNPAWICLMRGTCSLSDFCVPGDDDLPGQLPRAQIDSLARCIRSQCYQWAAHEAGCPELAGAFLAIEVSRVTGQAVYKPRRGAPTILAGTT